MDVESVDERDSGWELNGSRLRVYLFSGGDEPYRSWTTRTDDITDAEVDEVIAWAAEQAGNEMLYAVALVHDDRAFPPGQRRGLIWLIGTDANVGSPSDDERQRLDAMHRRRARYTPATRGGPAQAQP